MPSEREQSATFPQPAATVFDGALGVVQGMKGASVLAVHTSGRKLIVRTKSAFSNAKIWHMAVKESGAGSELLVVVDTDPRAPKALMDGKVNEKAVKKYVEDVRGAVDGSSPAPATPVPDHFVQKKEQVPWVDAEQYPAIELGGGIRAAYGL